MSFRRNCRQRSGAALVGVILAMVVLSLLITSLLGLSLAESRHSIRSEQSLQALYHAKTLALSAADYLVTNRNEVPVKNIYGAGAATIFNGAYENGNAVVQAQGTNPNTIMIRSNWTNGSLQGTTGVRLQKNVPPPIAGDYGIQSKSTIYSNSVHINANIAAFDTDVVLPSGFLFTDADTYDDPEEYFRTFPEIAEWPTGISPYTIPGGINDETEIDAIDINNDYVYIDGDVRIQGANKNLIFKTNTVMYVYIDGDFILTGQGSQAASLVLQGTGAVHIIVNGNLDLGGNCVNELGVALSPLKFTFYVPASGNIPETRTAQLSGNTNISATIVAPDINMTQSGSSVFSGLSWVNSFAGNGQIIYTQNPIPDNALDDGFFSWPLQITAYVD